MVTLKDIAVKTGVSIRSVSHAVNNTGRLAPETRRRILETAAGLGYYPNAAARSLVTHSNRLIGILVPYLHVGFYGRVIGGLELFARQHDYTLLLMSPSTNYSEHAHDCIRMLQYNVDGIIVVPELLDATAISLIGRSKIPVVQLQGHRSELGPCSIQIDNFGAAVKAVRFLHDSGCRNLAIMAHSKLSCELAERERGFAETVEKLMPGKKPVVVESGFWPRDTAAAAKRLFDLHPETDGVFAVSDMCAVSVAREALARGKKIPEELSVIGFDNQEIASEQVVYPISTVDQPKEELGRLAGQMLLDIIEKRPVSSIVLETPLILRGTTRQIERTVEK